MDCIGRMVMRPTERERRSQRAWPRVVLWKSFRKLSVQRSVVRSIAWLGLWRGQRKWADFHRLDQAVRKGEPVAHVLIGKNCSSQVAHDLMHIDQDMLGLLEVKSHRLHVWVDLAPLLPPIVADLLMPADKTAFERSRPSHVRSHE